MFTGEIKRYRSRTPLYIGIAVIVIILAIVLLLPLPRTVRSTYKLTPIATADLPAPRAGTIAQVVASDGVFVERGGTIAKYDPAESEKRQKEAEAQLAEVQKKLTPAGLKTVQKGEAIVAKAQAAADAAQAALTKATADAKGQKTPALAAAEKRAAAATEALAKAKETAGPSKADLEKQVADLTKAAADAKAEVENPSLVAPAAGQLSNLNLKQGQVVAAGAPIAKLDDISKLKAAIAIPAGEKLKPGQAVDLLIGTSRRRVTIEKVGDTAEVTVDDAKHELKANTDGVAEITGEPRSLSGIF